MSRNVNIDFLKKNNLIIFEAISGSIAYGTQLPTSDLDLRGVFILPKEHIYGLKYVEQVNDTKNDIVYYEIRRFLELVASNNPNILELLNSPEDCIKIKHPLFDKIIAKRNSFITKDCRNSFGGYAKMQINKAQGLNKKQNWERLAGSNGFKRKSPIDFCYAINGNESISLRIKLEENNLDQQFCGLNKVPNARNTYALYYDIDSAKRFSTRYPAEERQSLIDAHKLTGEKFGLGYKGIEVEMSNDLRLSSVPKDAESLFNFYYNEDGYSMHCKDYKEYVEWKEKRNIHRWTDVKSHGQQIDGKNMLHCRRLLDMAREIASGQGINVRRENASELLKIRKGEVDLQTLIDHANNEIKEIDQLFRDSDLPDTLDMEIIHNLLVEIRQGFYSERDGISM